MPRRRPGRTRADLADGRRAPRARPVIDGLTSRALSEIRHLECTRTYLQPGDISAAVRLWKDYVQRPERELWWDYEAGDQRWYGCDDPLEARAVLDGVMRALSARSARELRQVVGRSDAVWNLRPRSRYPDEGLGR
ncbi:hypothetical protein [Streptomyces xanthochromogenes]|uniref:hypothetical protein n=1 Tax=Streptomyces xanthochromogenes TaxID=67384 RepID=UPI003807598B